MSPKEVLHIPASLIDSLILYPLQTYVVSKVVEGLQNLDNNLDCWPDD